MEPRATIQGAKVLAEFLGLKVTDRQWVLQEYWRSLPPEEREEMQELLEEALGNSYRGEESSFELARERLLEDPSLGAGEKVLLAAFILLELYEIENFHSRQITENLREASNPVNNITAALTGLIAKGEVVISDPVAKNAHKRYRLTPNGILAATSVAKRTKQKKDRPSEA